MYTETFQTFDDIMAGNQSNIQIARKEIII